MVKIILRMWNTALLDIFAATLFHWFVLSGLSELSMEVKCRWFANNSYYFLMKSNILLLIKCHWYMIITEYSENK